MGVGMGIGAFAEGLSSGLALGDSIQKSMDERQVREGLKSAEAEARAKYGDELTDESSAYMMKSSAAAMAKAGRMDDAQKFTKWSEEASTKAATKSFASGLRQIDMQDMEGFDGTLKKLGKAKDYGPETDISFARGEDGKIVVNKGGDGETYYRIQIKPQGAKEPILQDIPASKLKQTYATWFNPSSAFENDRAQAADRSKREADIKDYATKKKIDADAADPERVKKERVDAIDALRKRDVGGKGFDDLPETDKEKAIQGEISLRRGSSASTAPASAGPSVVMDKATGKPVPAPGLAPAAAATAPAAAQPPAARPIAPGLQQPASPNALPLPGGDGDAMAALNAEARQIDQKIEETRVRSRSPETAETLIAPMRAARANVDARIRAAQEQRGTAPAAGPRYDASNSQSQLANIEQQLAEVKNRPGGPTAYQSVIGQLEVRRQQLIEELNQSRRSMGSAPQQAAPGLRMGPQ